MDIESEEKMTTYDDVYTYFISITKVDEYDVPSTEEGMYHLIDNGRLEFNLRREDDLEVNDEDQELSRKLTGQELMLLGNCMRLVTFRNMLTDFTSNYSMFQKEVGYKDYKAQLEGRTWAIDRQERIISDILFAIQEDYQ